MMSFLREITGKSKRNQEISYAKIARCQPLALPWGEDWGGESPWRDLAVPPWGGYTLGMVAILGRGYGAP